MLNKYNYIIFTIYIFFNFLYSQEAYNLKQWKEVSCDDIQQVFLSPVTCGTSYNSYNFILGKPSGDIYYYMWQFKTNKDIDATLKQIYKTDNYYALSDSTTIIYGTNQFLYNSADNDSFIFRYNFADNAYISYSISKSLGQGKIFILDKIMHLLSSNGILYQLTLKKKVGPVGTIEIKKSYLLTYIPKENTSIVILNNTIYYFSNKGFCSINSNGTNPQLISSVTVTNETSKLITDNNSKVWIINPRDGIIEYNDTNKTAHQIATFPISPLNDDSILCFYSESYLYLILAIINEEFWKIENKVYALNITESDPDNPDNPDNPDDHNQSGKTCGCLGLEFVLVFLGLSLLRRKH